MEDYNGPPSLMMASLYIPDETTGSIRQQEATFEGYSIRAHNPEEAGLLSEVQVGEFEDPLNDCPIATREVAEANGIQPRWLFESPEYNEVLDLASQYNKFPRAMTEARMEKLAVLKQLEVAADKYLENSDNENKKAFVQTSIRDKINEERRLIFGLDHPYGKIYQPENEKESKENFAHGNSASIALVTYQGEKPEDPPFKAVFKASEPTEIKAEAAKTFGITGDSESAKLIHRAVFFYELDLLTGMKLTPPTFYAIHNGQPGSCQEFVEGVHVTTRKHVPEATHKDYMVDLVPQIVRGEGLEEGNGFKVSDESGLDPLTLPEMSDQEIKDLFTAQKIQLTKEQVVDIPPLDLRHPKTQKALADAQLLDHLAGSIDRNMSNIFFVKKTDEEDEPYYDVRLIDNDLCLAPGNVHDNEEAHSWKNPYRINMSGRVPNFIDRETAERLKRLTFHEVFELLQTHQLGRADEIASQRERLSKSISAIKAALKSPDNRAQVTYRSTAKLSFEMDGKKDEATDVVETHEDIVIVDEWDENTYRQTLTNKASYLYKANDCRISELGLMINSNPEKAAEVWVNQFHLFGAQQMVQAYGDDRAIFPKLDYFRPYYQDKIVLKNATDIKRACDFTHHLVKHPRQKLTDLEQREKSDHLLPMMLGNKATGKDIGKALHWCKESKLLSANTLMTLLPQATRMAEVTPAHQQKLSKPFMTKFKFMKEDDNFPTTQKTIALSQCFDSLSRDREAIDMLVFYSSLNAQTIPFYMAKNKTLNVPDWEEFRHAMKFITPENLKAIRDESKSKREGKIKEVCFPDETGFNQENIKAVTKLLTLHFNATEPLNR
ncbi:hypothetical protein [Endozoicomonas montiporae]|nr:hypothetical protein [Endozoicomonas montiporae]AMO58666.1 hypothetical protein EZMO1_4765 [Endozoicomonas montiporae CL-33]